MDEDFCKEQTQRIRALAERADPFTRRRLLVLVGRYAPRVAGPLKAAERPLPVRLSRLLCDWPASARAFRPTRSGIQPRLG
ncbi:hypothetical protein ABIC08_006271 [Bradyrhizobium sp. RT9b]|uniref:hypothetical protein n=1 Tax=Bradyrhizobium sp. RT9b TaxID=3156385 RepID=UPI00339A47D4